MGPGRLDGSRVGDPVVESGGWFVRSRDGEDARRDGGADPDGGGEDVGLESGEHADGGGIEEGGGDATAGRRTSWSVAPPHGTGSFLMVLIERSFRSYEETTGESGEDGLSVTPKGATWQAVNQSPSTPPWLEHNWERGRETWRTRGTEHDGDRECREACVARRE